MKAIEEIKAWLESPIYWDGVLLYRKYGNNAYLKTQFQENTDSWLKTLLAKELSKILEAFEAEQLQKQQARPAEIEALLNEAKRLMNERAALKERARVLMEQGHDETEELQEIVRRIMEHIKPRLDEIFGLRDFFDSNGYLPVSAEVAVHTIADLYKRRNTLRTYISRSKEGNKKLEIWRTELFGIEQKLKLME